MDELIKHHEHACAEWDFMVIDDSMPEFEACLCYDPTCREGKCFYGR